MSIQTWCPCVGLVAILACGCSHATHLAPAAPAAPVSSTTQTTSAVLERRVPVSPSVTVSEEIREACRLPLNNIQAAPKFAFDESDLDVGDYEMLQLIGRCVSTGPLAGRALALTGRADIIGTEDYNMALGARRANTVADYLERFGVDSGHLRQTSRGSLDATGTDPATRQVDRRVDITLVK